ncbi:Uncharacterized protein dnl_44960 [Desulfonema limicola]|uniref:HepT-like domain-containing protein n=1 Tax=Desulfonema limicola TaxID=45656 RepID=A0A975BAP3_9BACT|nr:hypothetical protein [Desulfonema limicola]QTA82129.1 Uncharacterized protein dnl_44960 [Desulfonema limicola]
MNLEADLRTLSAEINKSISVLVRLEGYILDFQEKKLDNSPGLDEAMIITQSLTNYYTCLETIFLRISKFFENNLDKEKWHRSLLEKMTLEIEDVRPKIISEPVYQGLLELLKFRHFSRYYFELDYDWDKLMFLLKKFNDIHEQIKTDLSEFDKFLSKLIP